MRWCAPTRWVEPRLPAGVTVDRVRATLRWTGDWAGAAAFAALARLAAVHADRLEEAHREIGRLNTADRRARGQCSRRATPSLRARRRR